MNPFINLVPRSLRIRRQEIWVPDRVEDTLLQNELQLFCSTLSVYPPSFKRD